MLLLDLLAVRDQWVNREPTVLQGQVALKETLVSVTVASKGALKIQNPNGQKQKQ